jgi:hypothetical protein
MQAVDSSVARVRLPRVTAAVRFESLLAFPLSELPWLSQHSHQFRYPIPAASLLLDCRDGDASVAKIL